MKRRQLSHAAFTGALFAFTLPLLAAIASEKSLLAIALDANAGRVERTRAFADLRAVATDASISALVPLLRDREWSYPARSVLEAMPGSGADRALLSAWESTTDATVRAGLLLSLGHRRCAECVPIATKALQASDSVVVDAALDALGSVASVDAADALIAFPPAVSMQTGWADAALRVAEKLAASDARKSAETYRAIMARGPATQAAVAKVRLALASAQPAVELTSLLKNGDAPTQLAALAIVRSGELGSALTTEIAKSFMSFPPAIQAPTLAVLYDRADRAAAPLARQALTSADATVRAAAASLLSVVGTPQDASALLRMIDANDEPARAARVALARIPGEDVTQQLVQRFRHREGDRTAALEVLMNRGHRALLPELLKAERLTDTATAQPTVNAILALATADDLPRVLAFYSALPSSQRTLLEPAVRRVAMKNANPDVAAKHVLAAAEKLSPAEAAPLVAILAPIGGDVAWHALTTALKSDAPDSRKTAARALANWRDTQPASTLLTLAKDDSDAAVRNAAVQSAIALFRKSALGNDGAPAADLIPAAVEGLRRCWAASDHREARSAVVAALKALKDPRAIAAAEELDTSKRQPE